MELVEMMSGNIQRRIGAILRGRGVDLESIPEETYRAVVKREFKVAFASVTEEGRRLKREGSLHGEMLSLLDELTNCECALAAQRAAEAMAPSITEEA